MVLIKPKIRKKYTIEEYLEREVNADSKHEFYNGKIIKMPGGTAKHNEICANIIFCLKLKIKQLEEKYRLYTSDMKIFIDTFEQIVYPDALVISKEPKFYKKRKDIIINPHLVVEILSKGTERHDKGTKLHRYQTISTIQEILIIEQESAGVILYTRQKENIWKTETLIGIEKSVTLASLHNTEIKLSDIYDNIEFE